MGQMRVRRTGPWVKISCPFSWVQFRKTGAETTEKSVYLRLAQHVLDDPLSALRVIVRGVATLPSAIFSLVDVPFPVCSSFWHKISLLCQRTMVTRPSTPLAQTPQRLLQGAAVDTHAIPAPNRAHNGSHGETGGVSDGGWYHYPRSVPHVHEHPRAGYQNGVFCRFWVLVGSAPEERRKPSEQRCAYVRRCSEASRPRWAAQLCCLLRFALREALQAVAETAENAYPPRTVRI